ncbi:MAG: radical SAM protein [Deltaproteobacteria bacterium]|nr:radical SAM protein [Deltaproteobacteria bacterium]
MAIAYVYDGKLYLAASRHCTLACSFCPKVHGQWNVAGNDMSRDQEPTASQLLAAVDALGVPTSMEAAFVGLGEPTFRLDVVCEVGRTLRQRGHRVRLVTDGLANLRAGKDVTPALEGCVDEVNVSLNAPDGASYARLCPNRYGPAAHAAVCAFIRTAQARLPCVVATVVAAPGVDVDACRALGRTLGVPVRVRPYFDPVTGSPHEQGTELLPARGSQDRA